MPAVAPVVPGPPVVELLVDPLVPEPIRALVNIHCAALREPDAVLLLAVLPLVPVAPEAPLPPDRQPVTVMLRALLVVVWLLVPD